MDKNEILERRFSLNMTHLPNPIAESTCVNLNGSTARNAIGGIRSAAGEFRWGGSPISPKNRSNSAICLNNKNRSTATSPQRARMNLSKIDPRIYADVQSRGLVSRIVQYHESGSRLNRSMSTSNLYSKSGQPSIAQLQRNDLPYRATQQNVAMTRMAQPKKSVFYGNTLSSLLRSNSVISVQKSDEELSCENRPIMHPPPTENDLAPTRSVLDVLKEISRKRINSDDSDAIRDANKKYCNRDCSDAPQYETPLISADPRNLGMHSLNTSTMPAPMQSYKRQREHIVIPQHQQQQPLYSTQNLNGLTNGTALASRRSPLHTQHSPEQIAKKRLCSYNNDITSSLSSSLIHANKRRFYEQQRSTIQHSPPSMIEEYEAQKNKMQCQQADLRLQQLTKSLSCNTPITPLPATPLNATANVPIVGGHIENTREVLPEPTAVRRTVSEPPLLHDQFSSKPHKPKLTLFNRNYNEPTASNRIKDKDEELEENSNAVDNGECADIQFVKPKKSSAIVNKKNPLIERTQKSKLAMMLSGLRGEIYQGEQGDDEVDKTSYTTQNNNAAVNEKYSVTKTAASVTTTIPSTNTNLIMKTLDKSNTAQSTNTNAASAVGSNTSTTTTASSAIPTTQSTPLTAATSASTFGNFKLTSPLSTISSSTAATTTVTSAKTTSPLVGIKLTPQKPVLDSVGGGNAGTGAQSFNFGTAATATPADVTKAVAGTIATGVGKVPQLQGFSFGLTTKITTASTTTTSSATLTTSATTTATAVATTTSTAAVGNAGGFKFDSTAATTPTTTVAAAAVPTFGSFGNTIASIATEAAPKPIFAFGAATNNTGATTTAPAAPKPTFNFGGAAAPTAATTTTTPVFGAIGAGNFTLSGANNSTTTTSTVPTPTAPQTLSNPFGGGATASNAFAAVPSSSSKSGGTFTFGAASATTATTTTNAISSAATPAAVATTNPFSFGGSQSAVAACSTPTSTVTTTANVTPFAFGGGGANNQKPIAATTTITASMNTNNPVFSFGGSGGSAVANVLGGAVNNSTSSGNLFAFGGKSTSSESSLFGNNTAAAINAQPTASATAPTSSQSNAFTFGAVATQGPAPSFGGGNNTQQTTPVFGATKATTAMPFAFGGNVNKSSTPLPANNVLTGGFNFGANANAVTITGSNTAAASSTTNIFGTAAASTLPNNPPTATPSNTNIVKPTFNFGGASTTSSNDANKSSIFGGVATDASNNTTTFGGFAAAATTSANNQSNKTFSFGSNSSTNNSAAPNPFAAAANKPAVGGFAFNTSNATNNQPTAAASSNASTPFAFGGAANNGAAASAPFSFGNNSGGGGVAPSNKTFTFGSSSNQNNSAAPATNASSIFGGGGGVPGTNTNTTQQNSVAPFSFSAGAPAPGGQAQATANIFAPPAVPGVGGANGNERKIRRATRRLQKT